MSPAGGPLERYDRDEYADYGEPALPARPASDRSRGVALALGFLGGFLGLHRFYVGKPATGVLMICTLGGVGLWWLYDVILIAAGEFRDAGGRRLRHWLADDAWPPGSAANDTRRLADQVDQLESQVAELAERLDFAERLLARRREREG